MNLYDEYVEYMEELAPEAETWVQEQIAEELYTRDNSIKSLRKRNTELEQEIDYLRGDLAKRDAEIERLNNFVSGMKGIANTQAEIIAEQNEEKERLRDLLREARDGLQYETENNYPNRRWFAPDMRGYEQDMDLVHRIDAALAEKEETGESNEL